jgi:hypothetical protein
VGLHVHQIGVIQIQTRLARDNVGVPHIHPVGLRQRLQIAAKIKRRVSIALDAERLVGVLLRLEQARALIGSLNCCINWRTITASSRAILSLSCGSRSSGAICSGKWIITRRRDTPPLRSVKRIGLLFTARITAGICVE